MSGLRLAGTSGLIALVLTLLERAGGARGPALVDFVALLLSVLALRLSWRAVRRRTKKRPAAVSREGDG